MTPTCVPYVEARPSAKGAKKSAPVAPASIESSPTAPSSTWSHAHNSDTYDCVRVIVGVGDLPGLHKKYFPAAETGGVNYACHTWNSSGLFGLFFCREALRHSVIAHEIQHCVLRIAEYTGWSINGHTTEPSAFLSGWIARLLYRDLARHAEKIANN